jgi:hypothetical protein
MTDSVYCSGCMGKCISRSTRLKMTQFIDVGNYLWKATEIRVHSRYTSDFYSEAPIVYLVPVTACMYQLRGFVVFLSSSRRAPAWWLIPWPLPSVPFSTHYLLIMYYLLGKYMIVVNFFYSVICVVISTVDLCKINHLYSFPLWTVNECDFIKVRH